MIFSDLARKTSVYQKYQIMKLYIFVSIPNHCCIKNLTTVSRGDFIRIRECIETFQQDFLSTVPFTRSVEMNWKEFKNTVPNAID